MFLYYGSTLTATLTSGPTTTSPTYTSHYTNNSGPFVQNGTLPSTAAVTVVTGAQSAIQTKVEFLSIYNPDTVSATVTLNYLIGTTSTNIGSWTLSVGDTLEYAFGTGWRQVDNQGRTKTSGTFPSGNVTMSGLLFETATDGVTAGATQTQAGATQLSSEVNRITTNATAGNGVALPAATAAGLTILVINYTANALQVYGNNTNADTINGIATGTGVSQMPYSAVLYISSATGKWFTEGLGNGFTTSGAYVTSSFADSITAYASGGQSSAVALTAMMNRVTTAANQGASVKLPASQAGMQITVDNRSANAIQVFGAGTDTINSIVSSTGISQAVSQVATYFCFTAGNWEVQFSQPTQPSFVTLSASGAIPPHVAHEYMITKAGVAALTLTAPTATTDDGLTITVVSSTAYQHTITTSALFVTGTANVNVFTFPTSAGGSLTIQAYQGKWYPVCYVAGSFTS